MAISQNTATKKPISIAIQSNVAKKLRITITPSYNYSEEHCLRGNRRCQSIVLLVGQIGLERIMTRVAQIGLAAALLVGGATFAMAQNGPPTGLGYPPATKNPNLYGYYGYHHHRYYHRHYGYYHHRHYYAYHPYYHHRYLHRHYWY